MRSLIQPSSGNQLFSSNKEIECVVCKGRMLPQARWLYRCSSCGFRCSNLIGGAGRGVDGLDQLRKKNFRKICKQLFKRYGSLNGLNVLEVGCAEGWFLEESRSQGMNAIGVEPSSPHAELSRSKGFKVLHDFFPTQELDGYRFDYIIFNDVFEHLPNPVEALKECEKLLNPGGYLVLNLPSFNGVFYQLAELMLKAGQPNPMRRLWQIGLPSPHLTYFNQATLTTFIEDHSTLNCTGFFPLETITANGMAKRINADLLEPIAWLIKLVTAFLLPILRILPPDIIVGVFRKSCTKNTL